MKPKSNWYWYCREIWRGEWRWVLLQIISDVRCFFSRWAWRHTVSTPCYVDASNGDDVDRGWKTRHVSNRRGRALFAVSAVIRRIERLPLFKDTIPF